MVELRAAREEAPAQHLPPHNLGGGGARIGSPMLWTGPAAPLRLAASLQPGGTRSTPISAPSMAAPTTSASAIDSARATPIAGGGLAAESSQISAGAEETPRQLGSTTPSTSDGTAGPAASRTPPITFPPTPRRARSDSPPPNLTSAERGPASARPTDRAEPGARFEADPAAYDAHDRFFTGVHFFSGGRRRADGIAGWAHVMGGTIADVDIVTGGAAHDLRRPEVLDRWRARVRRAECDVTFHGAPCGTFSPLHDPQLRTRWEPAGMEFMAEGWRAHVESANLLWDATSQLAREQFDAGGEFVIEFPQRRYVPGTRAFWPEMAARGVASPGDMQSILDLERDTGAVRVDVAQCALGSPFQKFTTLLCSPRIAAHLRHLSARRCALCDRYMAHPERAEGFFADGSSRAEASGAYPSEMCRSLAAAGAACRRLPGRRRPIDSATPQLDITVAAEAPTAPTYGHAAADDAMPPLHHDSDSDGEEAARAQRSPRRRASPTRAQAESQGRATTGGAADGTEPGGGSAAPPPLDDASDVDDLDDDDLFIDPTRPPVAVAPGHAGGASGGAPSARLDVSAQDGIAAGPQLSAAVRARVEEARASRPRHASLRNLAAASAAELRGAAVPHLPAVRSEAQPPPTATPWGEAAVGPQQERPTGVIAIEALFLPGIFDKIEVWRAAAETAMRDIAAGRPAHPPATLLIAQLDLQPWARGIIWDTRDPFDCRPVTPSTEDTPPFNERCIDRAQLRAAAEQLAWPDRDLVSQCTRGGIESRSECSGDTVLAFHHKGIAEFFTEADKAIRSDIEAGAVFTGFGTLPFVPCRSLPRNVILQQRSRVLPSGEVEDYEKPRVTTNSSHGEGELGGDGLSPLAVNEGVPQSERYVLLPTVRQLGRGAAIVGEAGAADGLRAELYCYDLSSAYRFAPIQLRDWWQHVFLWISPKGHATWLVDASGAFGGAYMPRRFEGVTNLGVAAARAAQDTFDAEHPYPPGVRAWQQERAALQRAGALPDGAEQLRPAYLQVYLDDGAGAALNDTVPVPPELAHIPLGELATRTLGGVPSAHDSRAAVHLRIAVATFERLGFVVEVTKTECGSAIVNLGFRVRVDAGRIDCPLPKRRILLRDIEQLHRSVGAHAQIEQRVVERLVGRLASMAHALPEIAPQLSGGYAVAAARRVPAGRHRREGHRLGYVRLRRGSRCEEAVRAMCEVSAQLIEANEGIALASAELFAASDAVGTLTTITDASGEDGIGGYAFHPGSPGLAWLLADEWPADVRTGLAHASAPRAERELHAGTAVCSMPLAELFGPYALMSAVADALQGDTAQTSTCGGISAVISVVDCAPAASVLSAATSGGAQLRSLVLASRRECTQWLAAAVPRELNQDADTLSHPSRWLEVRTLAESVGIAVRRVHTPSRCWAALRTAMTLPMGREAAAWRESGEISGSSARPP